MGRKCKIPDGWLNYSSIGKEVPQTKFIAFKVPLKEQTCKTRLKENEWFTPSILLQEVPNLKLIVNLTNTHNGRYYFDEEFRRNDIAVLALPCEGRGSIPPLRIMHRFYRAVDDFMSGVASTGEDSLIGVHCTHGLNRTGYFICKYMVERLGMPANTAIELFEDARGHKMERLPYIKDILDSKLIQNFINTSLHPEVETSDGNYFPSNNSHREKYFDDRKNLYSPKRLHPNDIQLKNAEKRRNICRERFAEDNDKLVNNFKTNDEQFPQRRNGHFGDSKSKDSSSTWRCREPSQTNYAEDSSKKHHFTQNVGHASTSENWRGKQTTETNTAYSTNNFNHFNTSSTSRQETLPFVPGESNDSCYFKNNRYYKNSKNKYYSPLDNTYEDIDNTFRSRYQKGGPRR